MNICYIYREKEKNEHSIEAVFDTVAASLENKVTITKWYKPVSWKEAFRQIRQLRKQKFELYHITGDVYYLWLFFPWKKTVMTVHDIGMYKNNPWSLKRWLFVFLGIFIPSLIHKKMTAVSNLTKSDLSKYLKIRSSKIEVIENPLSLELSPKDKNFNTECPIIMQIGTGWHKNLDTLIESTRGLNCVLDIVGNPSKEDRERMDKYGIKYRISHHIPDEEVRRHYEECDILYFVSRSEGFGLPIIEAQTVGRPVLTTNTEPTKSVAGGGAILFDTDDVSGIRDAIIRLTTDERLRTNLVAQGKDNVSRFTKTAIADKYLKLYNALCNHE